MDAQRRIPDGVGFVGWRRMLLPLPKGEGRGEGEPAAPTLALSEKCEMRPGRPAMRYNVCV